MVEISILKPIQSIRWQITYKCNYNCKYCSQRGSEPFLFYKNFDYDYKGVAERLGRLIHNFKNPIKLGIMGGEFSIIPLLEFKQCMNLLTQGNESKILKIALTTNLSQDIGYYKDLVASFSNFKFDIKSSFHESETTFDVFVKKVHELETLPNCSTDVLYVINSKNKDFVEKLKNSGLKYTLLEELEHGVGLVEDSQPVKDPHYRKMLIDGKPSDLRGAVSFLEKSKNRVCYTNTLRVMPDGTFNFIGCKNRLNFKLGNIYDESSLQRDWEKILKESFIRCIGGECALCHISNLKLLDV